MESGFLEIRGIDGKNLPPGHLLSQKLDGSHTGKLAAEAVVMIVSSSEPDTVIGGMTGLVAEDENYLVADINCEAAEHWVGAGR